VQFDFNFPRVTVRRSHLSKYVYPDQEEGGDVMYVVVVRSVLYVKNAYGIGQKFMRGERGGRRMKAIRPRV